MTPEEIDRMLVDLGRIPRRQVQRYYDTRWRGKYPEKILRPGPQRIRWTETPSAPRMLEFDTIEIWAGPPAPFPDPPTADEFAEGVEIALRIMQTAGADENQELRSHIWQAASELGLWDRE